MYETEANLTTESSDQIPSEIIASFGELTSRIVHRTVLPWGEHCTECVWPTCYSTCEFYAPRQDGRCRRFVNGIVRIDCPTSANSYLLKIQFKRWGKLWTPGSTRLRTCEQAAKLEERDYRISKLLRRFPAQLQSALVIKRYNFKKRMARHPRNGSTLLPVCFLLECYNPGPQLVRLTLTIRPTGNGNKIPFQQLVSVPQGYSRLRTPIDQIGASIDLRQPFEIELVPNDIDDGTTLYFGVMDFVREIQEPRRPAEKVKCVVWDLDQTVWDGILVEDDPKRLSLKPCILEVIQTLDNRGILNSIASKNDYGNAMTMLHNLGIDKLFLAPQISWGPKSDALRAIARALNIGLDSILFVDDSPFELAQVKAVCPEVRTLDAQGYQGIPQLSECQVPVTDDSRQRRAMYQVEELRQHEAQQFGQDYLAFLKDCNITLTLSCLSETNLTRVHELTQRTNQMNFSGNRYSRDVLKSLLSETHLDTYVLSCSDRFGSYGVIGFSIVDTREPRLIDLMFSCRVQSKRIEHAFVTYLIKKYVSLLDRDVHANYRKTARNSACGRVFDDVGMKEVGTHDGVTSLMFSKDQPVLDDGLIDVVPDLSTLSVVR